MSECMHSLDASCRNCGRSASNILGNKDAEIEKLRAEVERLKAVLEGAQYQNIDNLKNESVEKCRAIGSTAALLTINLRSRLAAAEKKVEKVANEICGLLEYFDCIEGGDQTEEERNFVADLTRMQKILGEP